jgi:hypothetical protein
MLSFYLEDLILIFVELMHFGKACKFYSKDSNALLFFVIHSQSEFLETVIL